MKKLHQKEKIKKKKFHCGILERINEKEVSTNNKEDEIFLKASHKKDTCEVTKLSYKHMFKLNVKLIEENVKSILYVWELINERTHTPITLKF